MPGYGAPTTTSGYLAKPSSAGGGGAGDVVGPAGATDHAVARWDTATGKLLQDSGFIVDDSNNASGLGTVACGAITSGGALGLGANAVTCGTITSNGVDLDTAATATAVIVDHAIVRGDGGARGLQASGWTIDDNDDIQSPANGSAVIFSTDAHERIQSDVNGQLNLYAGNQEQVRIGSGYLMMRDNQRLQFGNSSTDTTVRWQTGQTPDCVVFAMGTQSRHTVFCETGDVGFDFSHAQDADPTIYVHSSNQSTTEFIGIRHDKTDAQIVWGTGLLDLANASMGGTTVTNDDYFEIQIGGVTKKVMCGS